MEKKQLMLYFHIPFCLSKCAYCAFVSKPCYDEELKDRYVNALINQINGFADSDKYRVCSVYFGGGTPTVLGCNRLALVLNAVKKRFDLENDAEITVEANPNTVNGEGFRMLKSCGFNRISLGAQSFNDSTLKLIKRRHTATDFERCYAEARDAGFNNISADLIFGLPNERLDMLEYSINKLLSLQPEHISVYGLSIEEGTPLFKNKHLYTFPAEDEEEAQYAMVCKLLAAAGYAHYEISNFAKPNKHARHNTGYWKRIPYIGFGAAAHSFYNNKRFFALDDTEEFINKAALGTFAPTNYHSTAPLTDDEAEEERIILGLRLSEGIELRRSTLPHQLLTGGFAVYKNGILYLTEKGFRVSNHIISMLLNSP